MKWFKDKVLGLLAKYSGASALWEKARGYKTYASGGALFFGGLATLLSGATDLQSFQQAYQWALSLPSDPAWIRMLEGLALVGLRNAMESRDAKPQ